MTDELFRTHRSLLFTAAYEVLGSAVDAEDVVQEAWLRWSRVDHTMVRDPRAYLIRIVTRLALNGLRTRHRRREEYVGEWLPEPLRTSPDVAEDVELAESVSFAMLTVLETLNPTERAVFVLHEVFGTPHAEIADAVGKTPAAVRKIAQRASAHVTVRCPRREVGIEEQRRVLERFERALTEGDLASLLDVLAPDVVMVADGGGLVASFPRPIEGAERVARALLALRRAAPDARFEPTVLNGALAATIENGGALDTALNFVVTGGVISHLYAVRNPEKLGWLEQEAGLLR